MTRQAYVGWINHKDIEKAKKNGQDTQPVSGKDYLVSSASATDSGLDGRPRSNMAVATYYNKGDTVMCEKEIGTTDKSGKPVTAAAMLYKSLYEGSVTIEESGFYLINDIPMNDKDLQAEHPGYYQWPYLFAALESDGTHWTELPIAPAGTAHPYDVEAEIMARIQTRTANAEHDQREYYRELTDEGGRAHEFYTTMKRHLAEAPYTEEGHAGEYNIFGYYFKADDDEVRRACALACISTDISRNIREEVPREEIAKTYAGDSTPEEINKISDRLAKATRSCDDEGLQVCRDTMFVHLAALGAYLHDIELSTVLKPFDLPPIYFYDTRFADRYPQHIGLSKEDKHVRAAWMLRYDTRQNRMMKLESLGTPDVIINEEGYLIAAMIYMFLNKPLRKTSDHDALYGLIETAEEI